MAVEEFLDDRTQILRLEYQLRLVEAQLETQKQIAEYQRSDITWLRAQLGQRLATPPEAPTINVLVEVNVHTAHATTATTTTCAEQTFSLTAHLALLKAGLAELADELLPEARQPELAMAAADLQALDGETDCEEVNPRLSRLRKLLQDVGDDKTPLARAVKGTKKGLEIVQDLARGYNSIAEWCGAPQIPRGVPGKGWGEVIDVEGGDCLWTT